MSFGRIVAAAVPVVWLAAAAHTVEIRGRIVNGFPEEKLRAVQVVVSDRVGVELGRARPDRRGRFEVKVTGPRYIIVKALLEGYPQALYQIDTSEIRESTEDREENKAFGNLRVPTYHQDVLFIEPGAAPRQPANPIDDLLAGENPAAVRQYRAAKTQQQAGDVEGAVRSLEKVTGEQPNFYLAHIELGMMLVAKQDNDRAIEVFTRAVKLRPDHAWGYIGLGLALNNKQDYGAALEPLGKAVRLEPDSVNAQFQLGQAAFKTGASDRALECFERVLSLDPRFNPIAQKSLASIYVNRQDPASAARALRSYLDHFPGATDADRVKQILTKLER